MPELRHMDSNQPECLKCGLFIHSRSNQIPQDGELAWQVYTSLNSPVVQKFNLQSQVMESYGLDLTTTEFLDLVYLMNAIAEGIEEWADERRKRK